MRGGIWVTPIEGWGFLETIDGVLAPPFKIEIDETEVKFDLTHGWLGHVISLDHKYSGMTVQMTPRHTTWTRTIVIHINGASGYAFSGMADTDGLECKWL